MKTAIIILSDPKSGSEEALGRVFNALAAAHELRQAGEAVQVLFGWSGSRWPAVLYLSSKRVKGVYGLVLDCVVGVSCGCADVFGADDQGLARLTANPVPGTSGLHSVVALQREGCQILTF